MSFHIAGTMTASELENSLRGIQVALSDLVASVNSLELALTEVVKQLENQNVSDSEELGTPV